ncbi:MAG: PIN domain nuclease [Actinobacteria bacterium]|nr:PIN domain nuclease [Actinomycetota bacterium]
MVLVDSSVWINFLRAKGSSAPLRELLLAGDAVACTEPVLMEVLAGARSPEHRNDMRRLLCRNTWVPVDVAADFDAAASIFAHCRSRGVTPRGVIDCLIAAVALRTSTPILASDRDFDALARFFPLQLV